MAFRVNAATGEAATQEAKARAVHGLVYLELEPTLRLFSASRKFASEDMSSNITEPGSWSTTWLKAYPIPTTSRGPFFEDIPTADYSDTEINADTMAAYILEHPDWDPNGLGLARGILGWSLDRLGNHNFESCRSSPSTSRRLSCSRQQPHFSTRFGRVALLRKVWRLRQQREGCAPAELGDLLR